MSQLCHKKGFNSVQAPPSPASLTTAPTRSPRTQSFFFLSLLVMSARMWKGRTSDSQIFDSIQGNYSHFILSVCHTFFAPHGNNTHGTDLILRIKAKLNHRADSQGAQSALVTDLYELSTLSERLTILRSNSSE